VIRLVITRSPLYLQRVDKAASSSNMTPTLKRDSRNMWCALRCYSPTAPRVALNVWYQRPVKLYTQDQLIVPFWVKAARTSGLSSSDLCTAGTITCLSGGSSSSSDKKARTCKQRWVH